MGDIRKMFDPRTVALIGGTDKEGSIGRSLTGNLLARPDSRIFLVNPNKKSLLDIPTYPSLFDLPEKIDLAVIATPAPTVPAIVEECAKAGVEGTIIVSAGFREIGPVGQVREDEILGLRKRFSMRIMGPNSLGLIRPHLGLNATPLPFCPVAGNVAFISQSGGFGRALLDWGIDTHLGFSMFASLGSMVDIDFGDLIDFLGYDPHTRSIMIYMEEGIGDLRKFISAARGFARNKPIVLLKPARIDGDRQPRSHTGYLATSDRVYDAVFKRVGVVRVKTAADLFNTAGVLYSKHLPKGPRLLVITNAGGVGMMAVNALLELGGKIARLSPENQGRIEAFLPGYAKDRTLLDLVRDADVERYERVMRICLEDEGVDGILVVFTPQGAAPPGELAQAVAGLASQAWKPIITTWMGGGEAREGREILFANNIPTYETPEEAVRTYLYMYHYEQNLEILYETPADITIDSAPPKNTLKAFIRKVLAEGRTVLTEEESKRFLTNYRIPTIRTHFAHDVEQALSVAKAEGYPLAMKIVSPDISYKSDAGGVALGIASEEQLRDEYAKMMQRVKAYCPTGSVIGVTIQRMLEKIDYEVILGAKKDEEFGSVILFGMGGVGVQIYQDFSIGLPPLNQSLARKLMEETRVYRLLQGYRGKPPADLSMLEQMLLNLSSLITDFPEISEMDINPVALSDGKAFALDARIILDPHYVEGVQAHPHLIITPYPTKYVTRWRLQDMDVLLRPVRPEDEPLEHEMLTSLSEKTLKERFFQTIKHITHEMHVRLCNIDYEREIAIVAEITEGDKRRIIAMGRLIIEPDLKKGEFAVLVHDRFQGRGLGYKLVDMVVGIAHEKGLKEIYGFVLSENRKMINMCHRLGCTIEPLEDHITKVNLDLS
ncbi:MAG: bifunctional acetate--CoA ligase family protein/GNAT family N-acetyltransferase [Syntrophorhabdales bacterium]|jgi:acetyltransferase